MAEPHKIVQLYFIGVCHWHSTFLHFVTLFCLTTLDFGYPACPSLKLFACLTDLPVLTLSEKTSKMNFCYTLSLIVMLLGSNLSVPVIVTDSTTALWKQMYPLVCQQKKIFLTQGDLVKLAATHLYLSQINCGNVVFKG